MGRKFGIYVLSLLLIGSALSLFTVSYVTAGGYFSVVFSFADASCGGSVTFGSLGTFSNGQSINVFTGSYPVTFNPQLGSTFLHWVFIGGVFVTSATNPSSIAAVFGSGTLGVIETCSSTTSTYTTLSTSTTPSTTFTWFSSTSSTLASTTSLTSSDSTTLTTSTTGSATSLLTLTTTSTYSQTTTITMPSTSTEITTITSPSTSAITTTLTSSSTSTQTVTQSQPTTVTVTTSVTTSASTTVTNVAWTTTTVDQQPLVVGVDSGQGSVSASGGSFTVGSSVTVTASPDSGWQFSGWTTQTGISCSSNPCTFNMPNNPVILRATFVQNLTVTTVTSTYTITH